jgi:diguanylate cyclase (GGDEF)-like protein
LPQEERCAFDLRDSGVNMADNALVLFNISRAVFLLANILLTYSLLTPKRPLPFQIVAFAGTWLAQYLIRELMAPLGLDPFLLGYMITIVYLVPFAFVFRETMHAKFFVLFMITSLSQLNFLIFLFFELFLFGHIVGGLILLGQLLELSSIPLLRKYITPRIRNSLESLNRQNPVLTLFPFLSFALLAYYGVQKRNYLLPEFIPLLLSAAIIAICYYLLIISAERNKRQQQMELIARTDGLTGLYNRRHMEQIIRAEHERRQKTGMRFALIIADIDLFKEINDKYGHACGDFLLKAVSADLGNAVREQDVIARWGGDEFLLVLPATDEKTAVAVAERIRETVEKRRYVYENNALAVTMTLGVYAVGPGGDTADDVVKKADTNMYQGKRTGRNRVIFPD